MICRVNLGRNIFELAGQKSKARKVGKIKQGPKMLNFGASKPGLRGGGRGAEAQFLPWIRTCYCSKTFDKYFNICTSVLRFCGFDAVRAHISFAVHGRSEADREEMLNAWRQRLKGLAEENPIQFPNMHNLHSD